MAVLFINVQLTISYESTVLFSNIAPPLVAELLSKVQLWKLLNVPTPPLAAEFPVKVQSMALPLAKAPPSLAVLFLKVQSMAVALNNAPPNSVALLLMKVQLEIFPYPSKDTAPPN